LLSLVFVLEEKLICKETEQKHWCLYTPRCCKNRLNHLEMMSTSCSAICRYEFKYIRTFITAFI